MEHSNTPWRGLIDIFLEPRKALWAAHEKVAWLWVPLILTLVIAVGFWTWYYSDVDAQWLREHMVAQTTEQMQARGETVDQSQLDAIEKYMTPKIMMIGTLVGVTVALAVIYVLQALYLLLVARISGDKDNGFGRWFSLTSWAYFPGIIATVASLLKYVLADSNRIAPEQLSVTSLNRIAVHLDAGDKWFSFWESIHLTTFWIVGLVAFGLVIWTRRTWGRAIAVAAGPYVVIFGIWAGVLLVK